MQTFCTERAREQVERVLAFAAYPGVAFIVDGRGRIAAAVGAVDGLDPARLARVFGARDDAVMHRVRASDAELALDGNSLLREPLGCGYWLYAIAPVELPAPITRDRVKRAAGLLRRMLARESSGGGGPTGASALIGLKASPFRTDPDERVWNDARVC